MSLSAREAGANPPQRLRKFQTIEETIEETDTDAEEAATTMTCADWSTDNAHVNLVLTDTDGDPDDEDETALQNPYPERSWGSFHGRFPWACFLAEGGAKKVYRVHNADLDREEALSVM